MYCISCTEYMEHTRTRIRDTLNGPRLWWPSPARSMSRKPFGYAHPPVSRMRQSPLPAQQPPGPVQPLPPCIESAERRMVQPVPRPSESQTTKLTSNLMTPTSMANLSRRPVTQPSRYLAPSRRRLGSRHTRSRDLTSLSQSLGSSRSPLLEQLEACQASSNSLISEMQSTV